MSDLWVQILEVMHKYYIFVLYITMLIEFSSFFFAWDQAPINPGL